jgi:hypothetical protein
MEALLVILLALVFAPVALFIGGFIVLLITGLILAKLLD